ARSPAGSSVIPVRRRFRREDFFSRMWFRFEFRRMILPVPVTLKRFLAPEWVFILGMVGPLCRFPACRAGERAARGRRGDVAGSDGAGGGSAGRRRFGVAVGGGRCVGRLGVLAGLGTRERLRLLVR